MNAPFQHYRGAWPPGIQTASRATDPPEASSNATLMALVVLLRGVNVGGHRVFRPSQLARELRRFEMVNIGAAGTFVVHKPGSRREFRAALLEHLPVTTDMVVRDGRELLRLATEHPFGPHAPSPGVVRFVSFLTNRRGSPLALPISLPQGDAWLVRVIAASGGAVVGEYRRDMKTIGYLGQLDRIFGGAATTRNWNTVGLILRALESGPRRVAAQRTRDPH